MYEPDEFDAFEEDRLYARDGSDEPYSLDADDAEASEPELSELADPDEDDAADPYWLI